MFFDSSNFWTNANVFVFLLVTASLIQIFYTFVGYPVLLFILSKFKNRFGECEKRVEASKNTVPSVTVVVAAHNEETRIESRIENILDNDYDGALDVIVVSDASSDSTVAILKKYQNRGVRVLENKERSGKPFSLNQAVGITDSEIIVFADARQRFAIDTLRCLVAGFDSPEVGAVSGELFIEGADSSTGKGVDLYWRIEKAVRQLESDIDSSVGCTGAVYAIRRSLYIPIPNDTLIDDVVIPMQIVTQGYRILFNSSARAFDPQSLEVDKELVRKKRTLAGNFQMLFRYPEWLLPWKNRVWWQLISHKYCRLIVPLSLIVAFFGSFVLRGNWVFSFMFYSQLILYALACFGIIVKAVKWRVFVIPAGFLFLNIMVVNGLCYYLSRGYRHGWQVVANASSNVE